MKISSTQQNLLDAMKSGVRVLFAGGRNSHWFRADNFRSCTATVNALEKAGLVKIRRDSYGMHGHAELVEKP